MIYDKIENVDFYKGINEHINKALDFLKSKDLKNLELGKHIIDQEKVFALVMEYNTHELFEGRWEAHRKYYDIQYILEGSEKIALAHIDNMMVTEEYNEDGDYELFSGVQENFLILCEEEFIILKPDEVHQPGVLNSVNPRKVRKIVVKALI